MKVETVQICLQELMGKGAQQLDNDMSLFV